MPDLSRCPNLAIPIGGNDALTFEWEMWGREKLVMPSFGTSGGFGRGKKIRKEKERVDTAIRDYAQQGPVRNPFLELADDEGYNESENLL